VSACRPIRQRLVLGEVVDPKQIGGVNEYSLATAQARARNLIQKTIHLLHEHMVKPDYPGIVFALGGICSQEI
jgi:hypothetical protein